MRQILEEREKIPGRDFDTILCASDLMLYKASLELSRHGYEIGRDVRACGLLSLASTMMEISSLAFLGLSSKPPYPEWGFMINEGRKVLMTAPWQALMPGFAILLTVIILNRLGDAVQDYMELTKESV